MNNSEQCYNCKFRGTLYNSAHSKCNAEWRTPQEMPKGEDWGIKNGWFYFPYNYDPVWMNDKCVKFNPK